MNNTDFYQFDCGCRFKIIGPPPLPKCKLPAIEVNWDNVNLDCKATYDLLATGKTKMVFQLEKGAGKQGSKKLRPEEIEHMGALGALLRPGCANSVDAAGVSTTEHFYKRKNGEEEVTSYHPVLDPILGPTYNCLIYQEQAMKIAEVIAGFTKQEADNLRKAIGKKLAEEMAKVKKWFIEGAKRVGIVTEKQAEEIFGWIKESQKYSFNKSHALCYGITGYHCAFAKAHFPVHAYNSWLRYAQDKQKPLEEYAELVEDAKIMGVEVYPPNIIDKQVYFYTDGEIINYGLSNVKSIGVNTAKKIIDTISSIENNFKPISQWTWYEFLVLASPDIKKTAMENLIATGAFRNMNEMRCKMAKEYEAVAELKDGELSWVQNNVASFTNIVDALESVARTKKEGGGCHTINRVKKIESRTSLLRNPIVAYRDNPGEIANSETQLLGTSITCNIADGKPGDRWTVTCKDCVTGNLPKLIIIKATIEMIKEITIKKGKEENIGKVMAFLKVSDSTCSLEDLSCFADIWEQHKDVLSIGRVAEIQLEQSYKGNRLHVKNIWMI